MRILGLDPGIATTGFACIEQSKNKVYVLDCGCIKTDKSSPLAERLLELSEDIEKLIQKLHPETVAIEKIYFAKNVKTGISVAQARGIILTIAQKYHLDIYEYSPNQVKIAISGDGHADKLQIQKMVKVICDLSSPPQSDDAADALAIALCHGSNYLINMVQ